MDVAPQPSLEKNQAWNNEINNIYVSLFTGV